ILAASRLRPPSGGRAGIPDAFLRRSFPAEAVQHEREALLPREIFHIGKGHQGVLEDGGDHLQITAVARAQLESFGHGSPQPFKRSISAPKAASFSVSRS